METEHVLYALPAQQKLSVVADYCVISPNKLIKQTVFFVVYSKASHSGLRAIHMIVPWFSILLGRLSSQLAATESSAYAEHKFD